MASMLEIEIDAEKMEQGFIQEIKLKNGGVKKVFKVIVSIDDDERYGNNVSAYMKQTDEERQRKDKRHYVGNGKCFWHNGKISTIKEIDGGESSEPKPASAPADDIDEDVPF